jgi:hypothetical protein
MGLHFQVGDRVRIASIWSGRGRRGTLIRSRMVVRLNIWVVELDKRRCTGHRRAFVPEGVLRPDSTRDPDWLSPGKRVVVYASGVRRQRCTLIRRTRLWWNGKRGWLVELDKPYLGLKRMRVGEWGLIPAERGEELDLDQ